MLVIGENMDSDDSVKNSGKPDTGKQARAKIISRRFQNFLKNHKDPRIRSNLSHIQNEVTYCLPGFQKDPAGIYILLIDDLTYITKTVSYMLERAGYHVFTAKNGMEAIILFQKIIPDIVITDIRLPDFNGFEIGTLIRQVDDFVPLIFITAVDVDINSFSSIEGKKAFLQKPIKSEVLLETIRELQGAEAALLKK
jgi:CheY-like chemotaxis protein